MQSSAVFVLLAAVVATSNGFLFTGPMIKHRGAAPMLNMMSTPDNNKPSVELVPLDKTNMKNAAAVTGGILGFVLGGPVIAAVLAAITNYAADKEGDSGDALRGVGKAVIESYNYLNTVNSKYSLTSKASDTISGAVDSLEGDQKEVVGKVKSTYSTATEKLSEINKEFDLVGKGKELTVAAATLSEAAIDKVLELNDKYDFVSSAKTAANKAVDTVKTQIDSATAEADTPPPAKKD